MLSSGVGFFSPVKHFFDGTPEHIQEGWYKNVSEVMGKTDDYSPIFIPREYLMRHLYAGTVFEEDSKITHNTADTSAVNICKSERLCLHPFVFTDTSFLRKCITMYNARLLQKTYLEFSSKIS